MKKEKKTLLKKNAILKIEHIQKSYNKNPILRDISMEVRQGEVVGLLGPNGAGKTTCFHCVTGLISINRGHIFMNDTNITNLPFYQRARLGLGYLPQENSIFRTLTVEQNIMAILEIVEKNPARRKQRCEELLAEFSIDRLAKSLAMSLSGGERRRAEIARALATNPKFILLDEPFAGVDPIAVGDIRKLVSHLKDRGLGVFITDHNVRETLEITDRAYVLYGGKILKHGTPKQITSDKTVREVYLGEKFKY
ncbi:MAG: LPS export ABC transporter ATP-binding protein [Alphaproteobacteria bacterium]|nr:LPS export ABC transporter ATP-binding protein [Alphaproteobacteria bacterium]